jgi:16S rRNA (cytosine967-C5)-methyltransferase
VSARAGGKGAGARNKGIGARGVAATVLARVEKDRAFASASLEAELARAAQLDARDRGLATELAYGALRVRPWLESELGARATHGIAKLDATTRAHLCVAAYQLFFLSRVPAFAAVSECVEAVRRVKGERVAAFANAILRRTARETEGRDDAARAELRRAAIVASTAPWLKEALARALGDADAFLEASTRTPPVCLRVERASERDAWLARLGAGAGTFEPGRVSPHAICARDAGKPQSLAGYDEGAWSVQEEGSQLVALAVGAREGESVLDACAGRGNKTAMLARAVGATGAVDACDLHASKLDQLARELARVGLAARATYAVDWSVGAGDVTSEYDRVLVDAPCSGVGTLRRRPELQTRRAPEDLASLAQLELAIASRAAERVRPGGRLVYAVCSVLREEAEDVVVALLAARPDLSLAPFDSDAARALAGEATALRLTPAAHGTDGYFLASFRRG